MTSALTPHDAPATAPISAGIPTERGRRAMRVLRDLRRDPLAGFAAIADRYSDAALLEVGGFRLCVLSHPALVEQVIKPRTRMLPDKGRAIRVAGLLLGNGLLNSEGDFHLRQRRMAQPAFQPRRLAPYVEPMVSRTVDAIDAMHDGDSVAMEPTMSALTLRIAGDTMFGVDLAAEEHAVARSLGTALDAFRIGLHPLAPLAERIPLPIFPPLVRVRRARAQLLGLVARIVAERRAEPAAVRDARSDLLSLLLQARDEDGAPMPDEQLYDEALTLLLAGHETTANALAWTWQLLAEHPDVRARLDEELDQVLGGRLPTLDDVDSLTFTRAVLCESLRLFPPGPALARCTTGPIELVLQGGSSVNIPTGTEIALPQWVIHRDERWWPEPLGFRPDRFLDGSADSGPQFAWFPFGGGRRVCIGQGFALLEGILVIATMAQQLTFETPPSGASPRPEAKFTVRPANGAPLVARRRIRRTPEQHTCPEFVPRPPTG